MILRLNCPVKYAQFFPNIMVRGTPFYLRTFLGFIFLSFWNHEMHVKLFFFNVYLFLKERESVSRGGTEREGESEAGPRL